MTRVGEPGLELKAQFPEKRFSFSVAFPPVGLETGSYPETSVSSQTEMLQCLPITHGVSSFWRDTLFLEPWKHDQAESQRFLR